MMLVSLSCSSSSLQRVVLLQKEVGGYQPGHAHPKNDHGKINPGPSV
jgi:hypothetical protein